MKSRGVQLTTCFISCLNIGKSYLALRLKRYVVTFIIVMTQRAMCKHMETNGRNTELMKWVENRHLKVSLFSVIFHPGSFERLGDQTGQESIAAVVTAPQLRVLYEVKDANTFESFHLNHLPLPGSFDKFH